MKDYLWLNVLSLCALMELFVFCSGDNYCVSRPAQILCQLNFVPLDHYFFNSDCKEILLRKIRIHVDKYNKEDSSKKLVRKVFAVVGERAASRLYRVGVHLDLNLLLQVKIDTW